MSGMAQLPGKKRRVINTFSGINRAVSPFDISDGESADMTGLDTYAYPQLATAREPGEAKFYMDGTGEQQYFFLKRITNSQFAIAVDGHRYIYDTANGDFKHYFKSRDDFDSGTKTLTTLPDLFGPGGKSDVLKFGDYYMSTAQVSAKDKFLVYYSGIVSDSIREETWGADMSYSENDLYLRLNEMATSVEANYMTVNQFRIYTASLKDSKMHYCGQNAPNSWKSDGDAGEIEITTYDGENGSAIATFGGVVLYFKNHSMHEFYGNTAANGRLVMLSGSIGCMSHHSIAEVGGRLYWLGDGAIYCYDGGKIPHVISEPVKEYLQNLDYTECSASTDGRRYIIRLAPSGGGMVMLSYDTTLGVWSVLSELNVRAMTGAEGKVYGIMYESGQRVEVKNLFECEHTGDWHWESKYFAARVPGNKQNFRSVTVLFKKPPESQLCVSVINNKGQKYESTRVVNESVGVGEGDYLQTIKILLPAEVSRLADWIQIKINGKGSCRIYSIETEYRERGGAW